MELNELLDSANPLRKFQISPFDSYLEATPLLCVGGTKIISEGNISSIVGMPKSRKTSFAILLASAYIRGNIESINRPSLNAEHLLWIDTEQSHSDCKRVYSIIAKGADIDPDAPIPNFTMLSLRDQPASERWDITTKAIESLKPKLIFIDGIADFVNEQNDEPTAARLQDYLLQVTSQHSCHICAIIHANDGETKPRGHTGSNLVRKCETIIYIKRFNEFSYAKFLTRGKDVSDIKFIIEPQGTPYPFKMDCANLDARIQMVKDVIPVNEFVNYSTLVARLKAWREERGTPVSERQCKNIVRSLHIENLISKNAYGNYGQGTVTRNPPKAKPKSK